MGDRCGYSILLRVGSGKKVCGQTFSDNPGGGGVLRYMGYIGMCRCEGYGFQAVYSSIGYIN